MPEAEIEVIGPQTKEHQDWIIPEAGRDTRSPLEALEEVWSC